jgi:hypothetical protein
MDDFVPFYSSPGVFDLKEHNILTSNTDASHQPFDVAMSQVLSFPQETGPLYSTSHNTTSDNFFSKELQTHQQSNDPSNPYSSIQQLDHYHTYPQYSSATSNDIASQLALFDASQMGVNWESTVPAFGASRIGSKANNSVSKTPPRIIKRSSHNPVLVQYVF